MEYKEKDEAQKKKSWGELEEDPAEWTDGEYFAMLAFFNRK